MTSEDRKKLLAEHYPDDSQMIIEEEEQEDFLEIMARKRKGMRPSEEMLKLRNPNDFNISKLKDEVTKKKEIKFDSLCPMFAFYFPCTNLILKDYCPYQHIEDCRKAYHKTM